MAYSKIILNGETLMDVTSDTVDAGDLLSGETATKNDGTKVTGNIATKSSSDLTVNGATVTAPAGYYNTAASKAVTTTTHPNPTAAITSSTGVVTATHTQGTGYVTGGTTTGILNLTTQAAQTINTSTADQTIASYRWLTGTQTIKSVTTSNLTAANIANGVTVKVGDVNNASRITQVTGTYAPALSSLTVTPTETAQTFNATGVYGYKPVTVNAISSTYIGTGVAKKSSTDTTFASTTGTFTAPAGYYSTAATKTITMQAAQTIYPSTATQYINSYRWLTGSQTIASVTTSNLTAENIAEGVVVKVGDANNASRITQITGTYAGDTSWEDAIIHRNLGSFSTYENSRVRLIGYYAFASVVGLKSVYIPNVSNISHNAFDHTQKMVYISAPQVSSLGVQAFFGCYNLSSVSFPLVKEISSSCFQECSKLQSVFFPSVTYIYTNAFDKCSSLTNIYMPNLQSCGYGGYYFRSCTNLISVNFPNLYIVGSAMFNWCINLHTVSLGNSAITSAEFKTSVFMLCRNLLSLYLYYGAVPEFGGSMFYGSPISDYTTSTGGVYGSIFVPSSLYNSYITATGWAAYSARMVSI